MPSPLKQQQLQQQLQSAEDRAIIARLRSELHEKNDELEGLESQLAELKNIIRSNTSGSNQLIVEALQAVHPDTTSESAPAAIQRLVVEQFCVVCRTLLKYKRP